MTVRQILLACGIAVLPWCTLLSQTTNARPKDSPPTLNLSFGAMQSNAEGKAAADRFLHALGGPAKVNAIKATRQTFVVLRQGQRIEVEQTVAYPDKQAQKMRLDGKTMLSVATAADAFMVVGTQVQNLSATQTDSLQSGLKHDFILVLQHIDDPKYTFTATGHQLVGSVDATVVDVQADSTATRWWIGPNGKLLQERYTDPGAGTIQTMTYSRWKDFAGLEYPTAYELFDESGKPQLTMTLTGMEVDPPVNPKLFERP